MNKALSDSIKEEYIRNNMELFEMAYLEWSHRVHTRTRFKRSPTAYTNFIKKVRMDFNYSPKTCAIDIWNRFLFTPITMGIDERVRKEKLKNPNIRRVLGYITPVKEFV